MFRTRAADPRLLIWRQRGGIVGPIDRPGGYRGLGQGETAETTAAPATVSAELDTGPVGLAMGGMQLAGVGGSALYGGLIGGVAASSWKGAATGAIAGATIAAVSYGGMNLLMSRWLWGGVMLAGGAFGGYVTYKRWRKRR
jgi:hypothetical protein